jgi:hypothetical protein
VRVRTQSQYLIFHRNSKTAEKDNRAMPKSRKYDIRVTQTEAGWQGEIVRRASAKKTIVSKAQDGFGTEAEAQAWADKEMVAFLELNERNKRKRV